ncbi:MAG TPA: hypothetical protein VGJ70_08410 [Solirubrobacteraceae bacterium]
MRRVAPLLVVAALAGCGSHARSGVDASKARTLVLQPSDLPDGYTSIGGGAENPFTAREVDPKRFGRKGGWFADYRRPPPATTGALIVQSTADVFGDAKGAARELAADRDRLGADNAVAIPRIGDESLAAKMVGAGTPAALIYTIAWRQRNVASSVVVTGLNGKLGLAHAVAFARRAAARVAAASR